MPVRKVDDHKSFQLVSIDNMYPRPDAQPAFDAATRRVLCWIWYADNSCRNGFPSINFPLPFHLVSVYTTLMYTFQVLIWRNCSFPEA